MNCRQIHILKEKVLAAANRIHFLRAMCLDFVCSCHRRHNRHYHRHQNHLIYMKYINRNNVSFKFRNGKKNLFVLFLFKWSFFFFVQLLCQRKETKQKARRQMKKEKHPSSKLNKFLIVNCLRTPCIV